MRVIKEIKAGAHKKYKRLPEQYEERDLNIESVMRSNNQSIMYKAVKRLVALGSTRVTIRGNPDIDLKDKYADDFWIFTGYAK